MIYNDSVYGAIEINEPLILELMTSPSLVRLQGVDQAGYFEPYFPAPDHDRFRHSVGVYLLLGKYGASLAEQVSGLIHDVSHAVFSHCLDYVSPLSSGHKQDYQDQIFDDFVRASEIPAILKKYNLDLEYILDDRNFLLKETNLPDLCADRLDYSLRDGIAFGAFDKKRAQRVLDNLIVENNQWIFRDRASAQDYGELFSHLNNIYWSGPESALMFISVGAYLLYALEKKYLTFQDLHLTDQEVLDKVAVYHASDKQLKLFFDRMDNKISYKLDEHDYDYRVVCKSRVVDPLFKDGEELKRLSAVYPQWLQVLESESKPKIYYLKFLEN